MRYDEKRTAFWLVLASAVIGMSVTGFAKTEEREKIKKVALEVPLRRSSPETRAGMLR
ncbi:MAG: hypothetical protein V8S93_13060 [Lachnospiraceae bacterium]